MSQRRRHSESIRTLWRAEVGTTTSMGCTFCLARTSVRALPIRVYALPVLAQSVSAACNKETH